MVQTSYSLVDWESSHSPKYWIPGGWRCNGGNGRQPSNLLASTCFHAHVFFAFQCTQAQSLQKIYHRAADAIHEGYEVSGEDVLREIQEICAYSLRASHEDHRLTVRSDTGAASPSTPQFFPSKVQRGRPRKRGAHTSGRASEIRRRGSYVTGMLSTSSDVSHSYKPSNLRLGNAAEPDTPGTWDTALSAPEFQEDTSDPNATPLDPEATGIVALNCKLGNMILDIFIAFILEM